MQFNKYKERGAYHWDEYERQSIYGKYARTVPLWVKEKKVLDVGAGDGLITHLIGAEGVDDEPIAVELAKGKGVPVKLGSAYDLPYEDGTFEAVFMGDTIEHLETPEIAIKEARRVLKPEGALYITTPPRQGEGVRDPYHYREYTPEELVEFVESQGFNSVEEPWVEFVRIYAKFKSNLHK